MSFGDANVIDGKFYVTAYNVNSGAKDWVSRVLIYSLPDLELMDEIDIGEGIAESVTKSRGLFWVTYHDRMAVGVFNERFNLLRYEDLANLSAEYGGYQGAYWEGDRFFAQTHGPNELGLSPSKGMDEYRFDGERFRYVCTRAPMSYGAGQGVAVYRGVVLQNDRPANEVLVGRWRE